MEHFENLFIGIAGMIGAGKSTLAKSLGEHLKIDVYYESVEDNEYLEDFYRDTARYAFATQIYLLNKRFQQHQLIIWRGRSAIQDRTIYEDSIFAKMLAESGLISCASPTSSSTSTSRRKAPTSASVPGGGT